jgi:pyridoxine/pyridoxamine 5'-phosphate oxidase
MSATDADGVLIETHYVVAIAGAVLTAIGAALGFLWRMLMRLKGLEDRLGQVEKQIENDQGEREDLRNRLALVATKSDVERILNGQDALTKRIDELYLRK